MATSAGHWWFDLVNAGTNLRTHVTYFHGERDSWDSWATIRKANPLWNLDPNFRRKLLEERDKARFDSRLKAQFLSFRLNVPTMDESLTLLQPEDWQTVVDREPGPRDGQPVVGIDLGAGRAWSSAVAIFPSGRIEAFALAPGVPDIQAQERRDRVPKGLYQQLADDGLLLTADGLRVPTVGQLWAGILERWGIPIVTVADRFREADLRDAIGDAPLEPRVWRWSEAGEDIRSLRRGALDGPYSVGVGADLIAASLSVAQVKNDDATGNTRLEKRGSNNQSRDDVAAALMLASGCWERMIVNPPTEASVIGLVQ